MNDQELLTYAAKAAGDESIHMSGNKYFRFVGQHEDLMPCFTEWNPLLNDADAFRLAVYAHIDAHTQISDNQVFAQAEINGIKFLSTINGNKYRALRRCITRAAAQLGKEME